MATQQSRSKSPARRSRSSPAKARTSKARGGSSASSSSRSRAKAAPEPLITRLSRGAGAAVEGHEAEVVGLGLVVLGIVIGLGVYADLAGPAGRAVDAAVGTIVGWGKLVAPIALAVLGVVVFRSRSSGEDASANASAPGPGQSKGHGLVARAVLGATLLAVAVCGMLHIAGGAPSWRERWAPFREAGGLLGLASGGPLRGLVGAPAAAILLFAVAVVALSVVTRVRLRVAARHAFAGSRVVYGWAKVGLEHLFSLRQTGRPDAAVAPVDAEPSSAPHYDEDEFPAADEAPADLEGFGVYDQELDTAFDDDEAAPPFEMRLDTYDSPADRAEQQKLDLPEPEKLWKLPPMNMLERSGTVQIDRRALEEAGHKLERALAEHGVEARMVGMVAGPTVTRYELEVPSGVKVKQVATLDRDIAYEMAATDVRILAPIPGKRAVGVEVPNPDRQIVPLGDILASPEAARAKHPLEVAVGRDITGRAVMMNLGSSTMPHILIAGATGAGKSSCLNSIITSILMRSTPDDVRMILVDPKRVEMGQYDRLPHLLTEVVVDPKKAANALAWAVREMERRYTLLAHVGVRDLAGYNAAYDRGELQPELGSDLEFPRLPLILVVVDELADLMMVAARDVEDSIQRIAQKARAVGIHLVLATQRPSVKVVTGIIKANVPARVAFAVTSITDSRVILDQAGAERLIGKGDMLMLGESSSTPQRVQGAWVSEAEVRKVVAFWRRQAPQVDYDDTVQGADDLTLFGGGAGAGGAAGGNGDDDDLVWQAMELVVRSQLGSTSALQRKFKIGFARAGRLMDMLEQRGVVGPAQGSKPRDVLMTSQELDELMGRGPSDPGSAADGPSGLDDL